MNALLQHIVEIDKNCFVLINSFNNSFWDNFFWLVSGKFTWLPLYLSLIYLIIKTQKQKTAWVLLGVFLTILLSDQIASSFFKPLVQRLRPSHEPSLTGIIHLVFGYTSGEYGFVSSHAANTLGLATFFFLLYRDKWISSVLIAWAFLNMYSRVYIGVHYPLDVICGGVVGVMVAISCYFILKNKMFLYPNNSIEEGKTRYLVPIVFIFTIVIFLLFGAELASHVK